VKEARHQIVDGVARYLLKEVGTQEQGMFMIRDKDEQNEVRRQTRSQAKEKQVQSPASRELQRGRHTLCQGGQEWVMLGMWMAGWLCRGFLGGQVKVWDFISKCKARICILRRSLGYCVENR
jgi:hypothetical protein